MPPGVQIAHDADARLIAAAPMLLEACHAALSVFLDEGEETDDIKARELLSAAIAKAETE